MLFVVLAPFDNEQSDLIQRVYIEADQVDTPVYRYDKDIYDSQTCIGNEFRGANTF